MLRMKVVVIVFAFALLSAYAFAGITFTTIDNPADPTFNQLLGINDAGVISGYFGSGAVSHPNQGYTIAPPYTTFLPDMLPASVQTQATGIANNSSRAGFWSPTNTGNGDANFGFIQLVKQSGTILYLSVNNPLVASTPEVNRLLGINQGNIAVGFYNDANNLPQGYSYAVSTGLFTPVTVQGAISGAAAGISNHNLVCGFFTLPDGQTQAFAQPLSGGSLITFSAQNSSVTQFLGINDHGVAVGFYIGADSFPHGVIYNTISGKTTYINDPSGVMGTVLNGINDSGQIVGFYTDAAGNTHGVLVNRSE
jgi:hypothetical protein